MLMRYPLPGGDNEFLAMSKLRLSVAVNTPHNPESSPVQTMTQNSKNAGCVDMIKRTVHKLYVTVQS